MRLPPIIAMVLICMSLGGCGSDRAAVTAPAPSETATDAAPLAAHQPAAAIPGAAAGDAATPPAVAINTRDPVDGVAVDPSIPPIIAVVDAIRPALVVAIGVSSAENAKRVEAEPLKYAPAAMHNTIARRDTDTHPGGY